MAGRTDLEQLVYQQSVDIRTLLKQNDRAVGNVNATANKIEARYKRMGRVDVGKFLDTTLDRSRLAVFEAGAARVPIFGQAIEALGPAGLIAAAGLGAAAIAATQAIAAMQFADEIDDTAQKLAIGTDALQEYRYAVTAVGGETKDAEAAIESFQRKLGEAQSGLSERAMKPFTALGFTQDELKTYQSFEDILPEIARRISALGKESERAAVVEKLGLGPMLPLLREGADKMEELRQRARDMGYVMDAELVKKGADANQQFETMARVIDVQLKSAFVDLSDEVLTITGLIADALKALNDFAGAYEQFKKLGGGFAGRTASLIERSVNPVAAGGGIVNTVLGWFGRGRPSSPPEGNQPPSAPPPDGTLEDTSTRAGGNAGRAPSGPSAEEIARRRAELERTLAVEIARLAGNEDLVRSLERERDVAQRTAAYEALKLSATEARAQALADQARIDAEQVRAYERQLSLMQDQATLELQRAQGNEAAAEQIERRLDLQRAIEALERQGLTHAQAAEVAAFNRLELDRARAAVQARLIADAAADHQLQLARIRGDRDAIANLERAGEIQRRAREIEGRGRMNFGEGVDQATGEVDQLIAAEAEAGFREGVRGLLDELQSGGLEGLLTGIFDRSVENLLDVVTDVLTQLLKASAGGSGPGSWIAAGISALTRSPSLPGLGKLPSTGPKLAGALSSAASSGMMKSLGSVSAVGKSPVIQQTVIAHMQGAVLAEGLVSDLKQHALTVGGMAVGTAVAMSSKAVPAQMSRKARSTFRGGFG